MKGVNMDYVKNIHHDCISSGYYYNHVCIDTGFDLRMFVYGHTAFKVIDIIHENIRDNIRQHLKDLEKHARLFPD